MKTKKRMTKLLLLCLMLALSLASTTHATNSYSFQTHEYTGIIEPRFENLQGIYSELSISSDGVAESSVIVRMSAPESYTVELTLQRQVNGRWYNYATWDYSDSTTTVVSQSKVVTKGYNYRVQATIEFADETETDTSSVVYY